MTSSVAEQLPASGLRQESTETRDFDAIYQTHYPFVWRTLQRLGVPPAAADDAAQDTFVVVHRRLADLQPGASVKAWLFGIAVRVARDYRRALRRRGTCVLEDADREVSTVRGPFERTAEVQAGRLVERFLTHLDDDKRVVFVMSELEELTAPEIAEALQVNLNTVYSRLRAARERFVCFVRERITAAVAGVFAAAVASKTLAQKIVGHVVLKLAMASAVVVTAGTLTVTAVRPEASAERTVSAQAHPRERPIRLSPAHDSRAAAPEAREPTRAPARRVARPRRKHDVRPQETLQAEMQVLNRASSALIHGDASAAEVILASYRRSFAQPMLQAEHDGLRVIADCLLDRAGSSQRAREFLSRASKSVLAPRVAHACDVGPW
jgi:RNA polymerase sigma-70 factor (ECF subfamily)